MSCWVMVIFIHPIIGDARESLTINDVIGFWEWYQAHGFANSGALVSVPTDSEPHGLCISSP